MGDVGRSATLDGSARERAETTELRVQRSGLGYNRRVISGPVVIRSAQRDDLPTILRLCAAGTLDPAQKQAPLVPSSAHHDAFDAIDADPNNHVYVAAIDGRVVGTFQLTFIPQLTYGGCLVAQVESVFVDPECRSNGVGATMMQFARAEAERRGALRLQLTSNVQRERAHRFYERLGYQATHKGMKLYLGARTK
jgi:GNAT superfamily N-acetyltransferase